MNYGTASSKGQIFFSSTLLCAYANVCFGEGENAMTGRGTYSNDTKELS